jgi:hypothetical protein
MKKAFFIPVLLFSLSTYGQQQENDYQIQELLKFEETKEKAYSNLNKKNKDLTILYKNGIFAYMYIDKEEGEDYANHKIKITYFIPKMESFIKHIKNKKDILNFIKQEIDKNDFLLQPFFDEAYQNAIAGVDKSAKQEKNRFSITAVNPDWSSELIINVCEIQENQYIVSIYYNIVL